MAKLHNYHVLCPLIDQKSFLGVSKDSVKNSVIVTLGRNVVNKYRLSDQKQIGGWTSKEHITSAVIYDNDQKCYACVFNNNTIKMWKDDSENLDKIKRYKFSINVYKIIPRPKKSALVIFSNGNCASLPYAIENRKTYEGEAIVGANESIIDAEYYEYGKKSYVCYITVTTNGKHFIMLCPVKHELGDLEKSKLLRTKMTRTNLKVAGQIIIPDKLSIYVLWSDSKISVYDFLKRRWNIFGTIPWVSTTTSVSIAYMGNDHLIFFGRNTDQDGAIIVAYNILLDIGLSRYPMKMYAEKAKLYCLHKHIILEASNHIGMLSYVLEIKRNLSNILGSHEVAENKETIIADWGTPTVPLFTVSPEMNDLLKIGLSERSICSQIITPLLEKDDVRQVFNVSRSFKDIPESVTLHLLNYAIKCIKSNGVDFTKPDGFTHDENDLQNEKFRFLNYVLGITFSDALLIPYLRNGLSLDDTLFIMNYITYLLSLSNYNLGVEYESKLFDWGVMVMDAFYQQYLMTRDENVSTMIQNMLSTINDLVEQLSKVDKVMPYLNKILCGIAEEDIEESTSYAIEIMNI